MLASARDYIERAWWVVSLPGLTILLSVLAINLMGDGLRDALDPWGQMFPEPLFDGHFGLLQQRLVGERHLKVMVEPVGGGPLLDGIAFNVDTALWPDNGVHVPGLHPADRPVSLYHPRGF